MIATVAEHDGHRLLRAVMRSRSRDNNAKQPLADWLYDHLPTELDEVYEVRVKFAVRYGVVRVTKHILFANGLTDEIRRRWGVKPTAGYKIETFHGRGKRGCRGVTWNVEDGGPIVETILNALNSFH